MKDIEAKTKFEDDIFTLTVTKPFTTDATESLVLEKKNAVIKIYPNVKIGKDVEINIVNDGSCIIGRNSVIGEAFKISGRDIFIERDFWSGRFCTIGGGSCYELRSILYFGYYGHLGDSGFINTAREVDIGSEVGLGIDTRIFTHGAYLNFCAGFPVSFGRVVIHNKVWIPNATILPNVVIGSNTVIAANSLVNTDIPSGCFAAGIPAKVLRYNVYPELSETSKALEAVVFDFTRYNRFGKNSISSLFEDGIVEIDGVNFNVKNKTITGKATAASEAFREHLRRYGIRFCYEVDSDGNYREWSVFV